MKTFEGNVRIYNEDFHIDTNTGKGLDKALKKLDPLISKMAKNTYIPNMTFEDRHQELVILALEGFKNFDPEKGVKLSTFIHRHLNFKIISKLKNINKKSRDAFFAYEEPDTKSDGFKIRNVRPEINFSSIRTRLSDDSKDSSIEYVLHNNESNGSSIQYKYFSNHETNEDSILNNLSIKKVAKSMGEPYNSIVRELFVNKLSLSDTAAVLDIPRKKIRKYLKHISEQPEIIRGE